MGRGMTDIRFTLLFWEPVGERGLYRGGKFDSFRLYEARREGWKVMGMCDYPLISIFIWASRQVHRVYDPHLHRGILDDVPSV
jgi:hypothetical protein